MGGFLSSIRATAHSAAFIVERSGMLVAASGIDTPYRSSGESLQRLAAASSSDPLIRAGGARLMTALQDGESFDAERQFAFRIGHARHLMRAARFRGGPGLDWYFAEVIPESDFAGPIYADMRSTAVFVALLLAASLAVTLALARRISAPLKLLTGMVRGMESGDLSVEFPVTGTREVSQLSDSFNAMAARLRRSFGSLAESEARYRAIFHRSAVSLIEADVSELHAALEGLATRGITDVERYLRENRDFLIDALRSIRIIDANETAVELLGAGSRDELLGPLDVRFDEQALSALLPAAVANAVKGRQQGLETSLTTRTGASIDVILNLYVPAEDDVLANMLISVVDITARTRAERERAALQEQLRQVQKVETIGRLAGGIAHDINNLLTPILAGAELLGLPGVDQEETAQQILGAANRVRELTRKLLAFSRKQELHREVVRLGTVVDDFQALLRRLVRREIDLRVLVRDEVDPVRVDVGQVEQVLMNLALNAQDAMPSGGTLTIDVHNVDLDEELARSRGAEPGRYVALAVTDTGFGMEAATLQHLFEPFYTTKQPGKGTGLGLSTVYGIVRQHGGHILVDSGPDRGTRFQIFFPRHDGE